MFVFVEETNSFHPCTCIFQPTDSKIDPYEKGLNVYAKNIDPAQPARSAQIVQDMNPTEHNVVD